MGLSSLPVRIVAPRVEEDHTHDADQVEALVKKNALAKALDVAERHPDALVIGADTVVVVDDRIIGKPKDLVEAAVMLRAFARTAQWVITGVAVVRLSPKKIVTGVERTKVWMDRLTEEEIRRYHQRVDPLDKAGGFDIEGVGALFIKRIEGCYTNVVGLPMPLLRRMLKRFGVSLL